MTQGYGKFAAYESEMKEYVKDGIPQETTIDETISLKIRDLEQISALSSYLSSIIWKTSREFKVYHPDMSSTATDAALTNGFMNDLIVQLKEVWARQRDGEVPEWLETNDEIIARLKRAGQW